MGAYPSKNPLRLTLRELYKLVRLPQYKKALLEISSPSEISEDEKTGLRYFTMGLYPFQEPLAQHIIVEEWAKHLSKVNWLEATSYDPDTMAEFIYLYLNPLTWGDLETDQVHYSMTPIAIEAYDKSRYISARKLILELLTKMVLDFADHFDYEIYLDDETYGQAEQLHYWYYLTSNYEMYLITKDEKRIELFDVKNFYDNIMVIVQYRGKEVATRIVKTLQRDWETMVLWNLQGIDQISKERVEEFERCLYKGFYKELGVIYPEKETGKSGQTFNVNGDYVAGNKYVNTDEKQ